METFSLILGLSNIIVACLIIGMSIPLIMDKISMNQIYGFRFSKSFESKENWYKINRFGGKQLIIWSIPLFFIGIITFFLSIEDHFLLTALISYTPLILLIPVFKSYKYSKKL